METAASDYRKNRVGVHEPGPQEDDAAGRNEGPQAAVRTVTRTDLIEHAREMNPLDPSYRGGNEEAEERIMLQWQELKQHWQQLRLQKSKDAEKKDGEEGNKGSPRPNDNKKPVDTEQQNNNNSNNNQQRRNSSASQRRNSQQSQNNVQLARENNPLLPAYYGGNPQAEQRLINHWEELKKEWAELNKQTVEQLEQQSPGGNARRTRNPLLPDYRGGNHHAEQRIVNHWEELKREWAQLHEQQKEKEQKETGDKKKTATDNLAPAQTRDRSGSQGNRGAGGRRASRASEMNPLHPDYRGGNPQAEERIRNQWKELSRDWEKFHVQGDNTENESSSCCTKEAVDGYAKDKDVAAQAELETMQQN